jgi:hypothetical protein
MNNTLVNIKRISTNYKTQIKFMNDNQIVFSSGCITLIPPCIINRDIK